MKDLPFNVLAEILASIVLIGIGLLWHSHLRFYFSNFFYKGINIAGIWTLKNNGKTTKGYKLKVKRETTLELKQLGTKLTGELTTKTINTSDTQINKYNVSGFIKNGFISLIIDLKNSNRVGYSTFLIQVANDGSKLRGFRTFYGTIAQELNSIECQFTRTK